MSRTIRSLWPAQIRPNVQSPNSILATQARALTDQTGGVLQGELKTTENTPPGKTSTSLDIVVPALQGYRQRILTITHATNYLYPASVDAEIFRIRRKSLVDAIIVAQGGAAAEKAANVADSDQELLELVGRVLQSSPVVSIAQSLLARAADAAEQNATKPLSQDLSHQGENVSGKVVPPPNEGSAEGPPKGNS